MNTIDYDFYKNFYLDLKKLNLSNKDLLKNYEEIGLNEKRICSESIFYKLYPNFDLDFYKYFYDNLNCNLKLNDKYFYMYHYHTLGNKENKFSNKFEFLEYTKKYNNDLIDIKKPLIKIITKYEKNNKKNIFHITHNFGGGTDVYISNLANIFNNYNHIIIKIINNFLIIINNEVFLIESIFNFLFKDCFSIVFIHNLLFIKDDLVINKKLLNLLMNNNTIKKIFIIHDYYLLKPSSPCPIKSQNIIYIQEEIELTNFIFNNCEKVIFNSSICYFNYLKHLKIINNYIILNNVPDIDYYNIRSFPKPKKIFNIGVIGLVSSFEHKGKFLLEKIIKSFENNYEIKFILFGSSNEYSLNKNVVELKKYNNREIFGLIKSKNIDFFLYLSTFEETYSFTLSIAIKFGLPIIYNNIGVYIERLVNYKNCFSFEEENYLEIHKIIENIKQKFINYKNFKPKVKNKILLYKNIPELSE